MSSKLLKKSEIKKILLISLSNIGDVILTFPVLDILKKDFPEAQLSVVVGPKAEPLLKGNPFLHHLYVFDKHQSWRKSLLWIVQLRKEQFDLAVDLRNTAIPILISPRYRTSIRGEYSKNIHVKEKHLSRIKSLYRPEFSHIEHCSLFISEQDEYFCGQIVEKEIGKRNRYIIVAPGAADHSKQWPAKRFASLCDHLIAEYSVKILFVGGADDRAVVREIKKGMKNNPVDLCGRVSLTQLGALYKRCAYTVVNDSAPMHMASYLNIPVLALFGPTDPRQYGPWSFQSSFIRKNDTCAKCILPRTKLPHTCMENISLDDVLSIIRRDFESGNINISKRQNV